MDRAAEGIPGLMRILRRLYPMPNFRALKCQSYYRLAKEVREGAILELGAYRGNGTISLWYGAFEGHGARVYACDDYEERQGWAGERYGPDDFEYWQQAVHLAQAHPEIFVKSLEELAGEWANPLGLLVWDLGCAGRLSGDVELWRKHILEGGTLAVHDTMHQALGTKALERELGTARIMPGGVWCWKRLEYDTRKGDK